jgi:predicted pyridoxine 5'-phosphate oxidase superfamily flavin-nucleotide-binding protein
MSLIESGSIGTGTGPWHAGELAMQQRAGVRERMAAVGPQVLRSAMPEQHRLFFAQLPFVVAGVVDGDGQPWASALANPPGFMQSPDPRHLSIRARPLPGTPLPERLVPGTAIGLLGIEPHTRRRNRLNGPVESAAADGFVVRVSQSFGNCPKYIQAREPIYVAANAGIEQTVQRAAALDAAARALIGRADTFFIATAHPAAGTGGTPAQGVDVSHRGGKPGFVRVDPDGTLTVPDFAGNFFFNTLGNLVINPRAGLLFIDFDHGDLLHLAVRGEIIWEGAELDAFAGAQRLLRLQVLEKRRAPGALPLRWGAATLSPFLARMGDGPGA